MVVSSLSFSQGLGLKGPCAKQSHWGPPPLDSRQETHLQFAQIDALEIISSLQTRCIVKGEAQKSPLFWRFFGVFDFLRSACSLGIPLENL